MKSNAHGPSGLIDRKPPGQPSRLNAEHRAALMRAIEDGPIPAIHGVVRPPLAPPPALRSRIAKRWRLIDLCQWLWETFQGRIAKPQSSRLAAVADALLAGRAVLSEQLGKLEKRLVSLAREDSRARLLMATPGVGVIVALIYVAAIDDPGRFRSAKAVGAHFGLTPTKYQSGETDVTGRISKIGDASVRTALYEAASVILTRPVKGSSLKSWAMRLAMRAGMRKAKVALARKLAVVLHRMLVDGTEFIAGKAAAAA